MRKQWFKLEYNNMCMYVEKSTKEQARVQVQNFVNRFKGIYNIKIYAINEYDIGEKWELIETFYQ